MKKLFLFLTLFIAGITANAQFTPYNNLNYMKLLKTPPNGLPKDSVLVYDSSDQFVKMRPTSTLVPEHNSLSGLQGGTADQRNHLDNAQVSLVNGSEQTTNKATDFSTVNNNLYPSLQSVKNQLDLDRAYSEFSPTKTITSDGLYNAFPSIIKLTNGNLIMVYRKGTEHTVTGNGYIVSKTSTDNGFSWSSETTVLQDAISNTDFRDPSLTQLSNGDLILSYFLHTGTDPYADYQAYTVVSTNLGTSWGSPVSLSGYATWSAVSAPVIQLTNGDLLLPTYGRDGSNFKTQVHKSTNSGTSWSLLSTLTSQTYGVGSDPYYSEPVLLKLANGDILATIRNEVTSKTSISKSTNSGSSWSSVVDKFDSKSRTNMSLTFNGRIIFSYRTSVSAESTLYPALNYSDDYGVTFGINPNVLILPTEDILDEYSSLCDLGNGVFGYVYSVETSLTNANIYFKYASGNFSVTPIEGLNSNGFINRGTNRVFGKHYLYNKSYLLDDAQFIGAKSLSFGSVLGSGGEYSMKYDTNRLRIYRSSNEVTLLDNGNFGLNTANPLNKFDVYGVSSDASLLYNSSAIANFRGESNTQLSVNSETTAPYAIALQVKNSESGSIAYPLKLNPLGGGVIITDASLLGTPTAPTATAGTNTTQIATTAFVLANSVVKNYKVYTALITQTGTDAPVATVLENTLGGTVTWSRTGSGGNYDATLSGAFTVNKTAALSSPIWVSGNYGLAIPEYTSTSTVHFRTINSGTDLGADDLLNNTFVEIRVYN